MLLADLFGLMPTAAGNSANGDSLLTIVLTSVLAGGLFTGAAQIIKARSDARAVNLETDPDSPRVAIGGAETAVTLMQRALESLEKENERLRNRIGHLEDQAETDRHRIDELEALLRARPAAAT